MIIRLIRGMRTWRGHVNPQSCRAGEKLYARSTCWQQPCARACAPQRSREQSASAPRSISAAMWKQRAGARIDVVCTPSCWSCEQ